MGLKVHDMTECYAMDILNWKYEAPYDFYNGEVNQEGMMELLVKDYYVLLNESDRLVGFFCIGEGAKVPTDTNVYNEDYIDIGLGLEPSLTGQGLGNPFFNFITNYVEKAKPNIPLRLTVATFNKRAIKLYKNHNFKQKKKFHFRQTEFLVMVRE